MPARLNADDYPFIDPLDIGQAPPAGYGEITGARGACVLSGVTVLLDADINSSQTTFDVDDGSRFPATPFLIQIGNEQMTVTNVATNTLTVTRSAGNTKPSSHKRNRTVFEVRSTYVYLIADHPVKSIDEVFVDDQVQISGFTAYTGQAGDELAGFSGQAVIEFAADAYIRKQFNLDGTTSSTNSQGITSDAFPIAWSDQRIIDSSDSSGLPIGNVGVALGFVEFDTGYGTVQSQVYTAIVANNSSTDSSTIHMVINRNGTLIDYRTFNIPKSSTETLSFKLTGGDWDEEVYVIASGGDNTINFIGKTVTVQTDIEPEDVITITPPIVTDQLFKVIGLSRALQQRAWVEYDSTSLGTIDKQRHIAEVTNPSGSAIARVRLTGRDHGVLDAELGASASETLMLEHEGGDWDTGTFITLQEGSVTVGRLTKEVDYIDESLVDARQLIASSSARIVVGADITVTAKMALDTTGDYGGVGNLITRPDWVLKHIIVTRLDFALGDIDAASFTAAGTTYAGLISGGYEFAFMVGDAFLNTLLQELAWQCRSTLTNFAGSWKLNVLPDVSPAAIKTITSGELAGEFAQLTFNKTPVSDLGNSLQANYNARYVRGTQDSMWGGLAKVEDATSIAKFGTYRVMYDFFAVTTLAMAEDVLDNLLLRLKVPLLIVEFPVMYENFELEVGDTIDITSDLWDGTKFYIESVKRIDQYQGTMRALQWWA